MMLLAIAMLQATRIPPAEADPAKGSESRVVVIGQRRKSADAALAACIARGCPPNEEIAASLRKADAEFIEGDYHAGRRSMSAARGRNAKYAKRYPELVSEISRVDARLASLLGMREQQRLSAINALEALRTGLAADDPRILLTKLEVGDSYLLTGERFDEARTIYRDVARRARATGQTAVYGRALLRPAIMYSALAKSNARFRANAKDALAAVDATAELELGSVREMAVMLRAKLDLSTASSSEEIDRAIATLARSPAATPVAVVAPPVELGLPGEQRNSIRDLELANGSGNVLSSFKPTYEIDKQWVDFSFWIKPDGSVRDVEAVRQGDRSVNDWSPAVRKAIEGRRYMALAGDPQGLGLLRVERYSMVSDLGDRVGSRIRTRSAAPHVEVTDLSRSTMARTLAED